MRALLEPLIIQNESFDKVLAQYLSRPDAKLRCLAAVDAVANGDDGVEVIKRTAPSDTTTTLRLNYSNFSSSCQVLEFTGLVDFFEVVGDGVASTPNSSAIFFWLSQKVSSSKTTSNRTAPLGVA